MGNQTVNALATSGLFIGVKKDYFEDVLSIMGAHEQSYEDQELLFRLGDRVELTGIVIDGRVKVNFYDENGNKSLIAAMGRGGVFAEAIAAAGDPSPVQAEASGQTRVLWLNINRLMTAKAMSKTPYAGMIMMNVVRMLARKNTMLVSKVQLLAQKRLRDRIKLYLLQCENQSDSEESNAGNSRAELAHYLNVDRSALSRELGRLRDEGAIALENGSIKVINHQFLEK